MNVRSIAVFLFAALALCSSQAFGVTVTLWSGATAAGIDGGAGQGGVPDGNFSQFDFNPGYRVSKARGFSRAHRASGPSSRFRCARSTQAARCRPPERHIHRVAAV